MRDIQRRNLPKRAIQFYLDDINPAEKKRMSRMRTEQMREKSRRLEEQLSLPKYSVIFHKSQIDIQLYGDYDFLCMGDDGDLFMLSDRSPFARVEAPAPRFYVFVPENVPRNDELRNAVARAASVDPRDLHMRG